MEQVPVSALLEMVRSVRNEFAPNLVARGSMNGDFRYGPQEGFSGPSSMAPQPFNPSNSRRRTLRVRSRCRNSAW